MILQWLEILASFDFTVKHRKGTLNGNANSLSRARHAALPSPEEEKVLVSDKAAVIATLQTPPGFTMEEIKDHQERDEHLRDIQKWKTVPPTETEKQLLSPDQRRLLAFLPSLHQDPSSGLWSLQTQEEGTHGIVMMNESRGDQEIDFERKDSSDYICQLYFPFCKI